MRRAARLAALAGPRGRLAALAGAALALSGCGVLDQPDPPGAATPNPARVGPLHAVPRSRPPARALAMRAPGGIVARELAAGLPGVVDIYGRVAVRPHTLATTADSELTGITWSRWDSSGASGAGRLRLLECDPNCATGATTNYAARITLSATRTCSGRRYFDVADVRLDRPPAGGQPTSYVRAPC